MCDTFVALPSATATGHVIFAKNSDREPNEAQGLVRIPRQQPRESRVHCTYIAIPQVPETFGVLLSKPFWMWGAEMGVNEFGVAIGNEAVFTKVPFRKTNDGLTGMDLLRLALERARTAETALAVITDLLEEWGQDACGGYQDRNFYYHNSFLIADPTCAFVLETAGRAWVAQRVRGVRSISNGLTIGEDYDLIGAGTLDLARKYGWNPAEPFDFARTFSAPFLTHMSNCAVRRATTQAGAESGKLSVRRAIEILSSHAAGEDFAPHRASTRDVCMHATGLLCPNQTVGSLVAELREYQPSTVWATGTSLPALSVFKPLFTRGTFPKDFPEPSDRPDSSFWWQAERLLRRAATQYRLIRELVLPERDRLQRELFEKERALLGGSPVGSKALDELSDQAFYQHGQLLHGALQVAREVPRRAEAFAPFYRLYWRRQNRRVGW